MPARLQAPSSKLQAPSSKLQAPSSKLQAPSSKLQTLFALFLTEKRIQFLFKGMVVKVIVQFHTCLHNVDDFTLVTFFENTLVNRFSGFVHGTESTKWIQNHRSAPLS